MKKLCLVITLALLPVAFSSSAEKKLTEHEVLVACNKSSSKLVESYEKEIKFPESKLLDILENTSNVCQTAYQSASDGMKYKDIERATTAIARKEYLKRKDQDPAVLESRFRLILDSIQVGFYLFENGELPRK
ncbi:hypothetical protein CRN79_24380 [Serratia fonticola]|uniref:hypothetical protein n=1 Tax=Serratia fonticola TaxID=47917 RepID=UPI000BFE291E|nr:hypothetical protein [Serratia fonticola]ATM78774.1 hypothetical protein CRN79_24380 [Serratia fonticola]